MTRAEPFETRLASDAAWPQPFSVIQNLFYGITVIAGLPNSGKSAFAIDAAACVASGNPFFGKKTLQSEVLYFAVEAAYSVRQRILATEREKYHSQSLPIHIASSPLQLGDVEHAAEGAWRIIETCAQLNAPRLVLIDTVAAALSGADENGEGMLNLVSVAQCVQRETGAVIVLLHHPSKADENSLRGHSSLSGATDVIIRVEASNGIRTAKVIKSRDGATGDEITFTLEPVTQPEHDQFGDPVTTVIVRPAEAPQRAIALKGKNQQLLLSAVTEWARTHDSPLLSSIDLASMAAAAGLSRQRKGEAVEALVNVGILRLSVGGYLVDKSLL